MPDRYRPYQWTLAQDQFDSALNARVDPSDVVQQTCLEIHRDFQGFNGTLEGELLAWAKRILRNSVANTIREHIRVKKRSTDNEQSLDASGGQAAALRERIAGRQSTLSARAIRGEEADRIAAILSQLSKDRREAVQLRHIEGWTLRKISEHLDRYEMAVAGLLKRDMLKLRSKLIEDEPS